MLLVQIQPASQIQPPSQTIRREFAVDASALLAQILIQPPSQMAGIGVASDAFVVKVGGLAV